MRRCICDVCVCSEHDWFKVDLPEYLFPSASDVDASVVDTDAIREVCEVSGSLCVVCCTAWWWSVLMFHHGTRFFWVFL